MEEVVTCRRKEEVVMEMVVVVTCRHMEGEVWVKVGVVTCRHKEEVVMEMGVVEICRRKVVVVDGRRRYITSRGRLAQLVERLLYTQNVGGSSPSPPTTHH